MKKYTTEDIIDLIKVKFEVKTDASLARVLGVEKQSIYQYRQKKNIDIQQKIIILLLEASEK